MCHLLEGKYEYMKETILPLVYRRDDSTHSLFQLFVQQKIGLPVRFYLGYSPAEYLTR